MADIKYKLLGRYMQGAQIIGFKVADTNNSVKMFKYSDVEELIQRGLVEDCAIIVDENNKYIKCNGFRLSELPLVQSKSESDLKLSIVARVFKDGKLIGYIAADGTGTEYRLSKDKVWQKARDGAFTNIAASYSNGSKILRGVGIELRNLPCKKF